MSGQDLDLGGHIGKDFSLERQTEGVDQFKSTADHLLNMEKDGNLIAIAAYSVGSLERLQKLLKDQSHLPRHLSAQRQPIVHLIFSCLRTQCVIVGVRYHRESI